MPKIVATKVQWIQLGYQLFSENGIKGVNVDEMSKSLKCNRSSFYWHFKSKKDFINELVEYWINTYTLEVITKVDTKDNPKEKLLKLFEIVFKKDLSLDFIFYLKKYGQKNEQIQKIIDRIDRKRITYGSSILKEMGFSKEEAKVKSSIIYKYLIGYHEFMRYKKQPENYLEEVFKELDFLKL